MSTYQYAVAMIFVVIGVGAAMAPLLRYVVVGWAAKRLDIMDGLNADARHAYFSMFSRNRRFTTTGEASLAFEKFYTHWYGRRFFFFPSLLFFSTITLLVSLCALAALARLTFIAPYSLYTLPSAAVAALSGAYLWVVNDFISRARRLDFSPADVHWATLRLVISVPMGYAFAKLGAASLAPFVAFGLGAFPLGVLTSMLQRVVNKTTGIEPTKEETSDDIIKLQGINRAIVERLKDEDITTVSQIAYCDPVRLAMRSNLSFSFVTDCMGQALVWIYFQDQLGAVLRPAGLRGAVEIRQLMDAFRNVDSIDPREIEDQLDAAACIEQLAVKMGQSSETMRFAFMQIAEDPFTVFLTETWT